MQLRSRISLLSTISILLSLLHCESLLAKECTKQFAPSSFPFNAGVNSNNQSIGNIGIVPTGFVDLKDGTQTVQGIDVSKWQDDVNFEAVVKCGGKFAYIRLSAGTNPDNELRGRSLWNVARSYGLYLGGYHNLTLVEPTAKINSLTDGERSELLQQNVAAARAQAQLFMWRMREALSQDPIVANQPASNLGQSYLPIALDASVLPLANGSIEDKKQFGAIFGSAICAWIDQIQHAPAFLGQSIILFISPFAYKDYNLEKAPCDTATLTIWITHHNRDGGLPQSGANSELTSAIDQLCKLSERTRSAAAGRCRFHQYTSFGGFAAFQKSAELDLDRFYGDELALKTLLQQAKSEAK
jgi:GH25 family lysozyme M1 (1,4-beta-N-acetylmuramidase)